MKRPLAIMALSAALSADPAYALFCGSALVNEGQQKFDVLQKCGEPAFADSHVIYVPNPAFVPPPPGATPYPPYGYGGYGPPPSVPIVIDEWVYNFGPTKMMPRLVFRDGVLWTIRYHGYGSY